MRNYGRVAHEGDPRGVALKLLSDRTLANVNRVGVTGRAFRSSGDLCIISEPEAVGCALCRAYPGRRQVCPKFCVNVGMSELPSLRA